MHRFITFGLALLLITACSADYYDHVSSASPDGSFVVDITGEMQGANDPDPIWQHVSLRPSEGEKKILPGNVAIYSLAPNQL